MEIVRIPILLVLAPAFYFAVGLPWAVALRRVGWAPLFGIGALGFTAELACMAGRPVGMPLLVVAGLHLIAGGWLVWRGRVAASALRAGAGDFALAYALALLPLVASPFPLPGDWSGDWALALGAGEHILHAARFTPELLARPPLFGAAAIPLLAAGPAAAAFQVFCAVASACALQVFRSGLSARSDPRLLWILAGSTFFLQVTANAWPKFLCAAFALGAWQLLAPAAGRRDRLAAGLFLGLAVATHQSAVLFVPLILLRLRRPGEAWRVLVPAAAGLGLLAALVVLPWELHTLAAYGWKAKLLANPAVAQRIAEVPGWLNALLVGVTTFVAWGPLDVIRHWLGAPDRFTLLRLAHEAYWFACAWFNSLAGCLLGLVLPWWLAFGTREFRERVADGWRELGRPAQLALGLALLGQMLLNPFYFAGGSLQTGWVPAGLALGLWCARQVADDPAPVVRRVLHATWWFGAGPWLLFQIGLTAALALSPGFRRGYADTDLQLLEKNQWVTLGLGGFPWIHGLLALVLLAFWLRRTQPARAARPVAHVFDPAGIT